MVFNDTFQPEPSIRRKNETKMWCEGDSNVMGQTSMLETVSVQMFPGDELTQELTIFQQESLSLPISPVLGCTSQSVHFSVPVILDFHQHCSFFSATCHTDSILCQEDSQQSSLLREASSSKNILKRGRRRSYFV